MFGEGYRPLFWQPLRSFLFPYFRKLGMRHANAAAGAAPPVIPDPEPEMVPETFETEGEQQVQTEKLQDEIFSLQNVAELIA